MGANVSPYTSIGWIFIAASLLCSMMAFATLGGRTAVMFGTLALGLGIGGVIFTALGILDRVGVV